MTIYFFLYGILALFAIISLKASKNKNGKPNVKKRITRGCFLLLLLLVGLRHPSMGIDLVYGSTWTGYIYSFHQISSMSWGEVITLERFFNYDKGYILLNKLIGSVFANTQFFLAVIALISLISVFYLIEKKSDAPLVSVIIYLGLPCFLVLYSALRQGIALGLSLLSVRFIEEKKPIKFILLILLAMCFHSTSVIFLLAYPIYHIKLNKMLRWTSVWMLPVVWMLKKPIFIIASQIFGREPSIDNNGAITLFLVFSVIYIFCVVYSKSEHQGYLNLFYVACCIQALGGLNSIIIRAGYYYMIVLVILLPNVLESMQSRISRRLIKGLVVVCFAAFGIYSIYTTDWAMAYPYIPFWRNI